MKIRNSNGQIVKVKRHHEAQIRKHIKNNEHNKVSALVDKYANPEGMSNGPQTQPNGMEFGWGGTIGTVLGGAAGAIIGGPAGAMAGASLGASVGGTIGSNFDKPKQSNMQQMYNPQPQVQPNYNLYDPGYHAMGGRVKRSNYPQGGLIDQKPGGNLIQMSPESQYISGASHAQGGVQVSPNAEAQGGEVQVKLSDGSDYILTKEKGSLGNKTGNIASWYTKNVTGLSSRNDSNTKDIATKQLTEAPNGAVQMNQKYLAERQMKAQKAYGKFMAKYGGDLETFSAEMGGDIGMQYSSGGSIHIKPSHKGRFTAYKERTGQSTEQALHSSNPHVRQMANFARNAAKWHHEHGGVLKYDGGGVRINDYYDFNNPGFGNLPDQGKAPDYTDYSKSFWDNGSRTPESPQNNPRKFAPNDMYTGYSYNGMSPELRNVVNANNGNSPVNPNSDYAQNDNKTPYRMNPRDKTKNKFDLGKTAELAGMLLPAGYNIARGLFDHPTQYNPNDYMNKEIDPRYIPENTGQNEIRDAYGRSLYDMKNSGNYSRLGQTALMNSRAKNDYERKLNLALQNAGIGNNFAQFNSGIRGQNIQTKLGINELNASNRAQKRNFLSQGVTDVGNAAGQLYANRGAKRNDEINMEGLNKLFGPYGFQAPKTT